MRGLALHLSAEWVTSYKFLGGRLEAMDTNGDGSLSLEDQGKPGLGAFSRRLASKLPLFAIF